MTLRTAEILPEQRAPRKLTVSGGKTTLNFRLADYPRSHRRKRLLVHIIIASASLWLTSVK